MKKFILNSTCWNKNFINFFIMFQFIIILANCHLSDSYIKLTIYPVERNIVVKENTDLNVTCKLSTFGIQNHASLMSWTLPMKKVDTENRIFIHQNHNERTVSIHNIRASDSGEYVCELKNGDLFMKKMINIRTDTDERICPKSKFPCGNNLCIPRHYMCDGHKDCPDNSDEWFTICGYNVCKEKIWCDERCISAALCCDPMTQPNCSANYLMPCCSRLMTNHISVPLDETMPIQYKYQNIGFYQSTVYTMISCAIAFIFMSTVMLIAVCRVRMRFTPWFLPSSRPNEGSRFWRVFSQNGRRANASNLRTPTHFPPHFDQTDLMDPTENFVLLTFNSDTGFEIAEYGPKPPPYTENNIGVPPPPYSSTLNIAAEDTTNTSSANGITPSGDHSNVLPANSVPVSSPLNGSSNASSANSVSLSLPVNETAVESLPSAIQS